MGQYWASKQSLTNLHQWGSLFSYYHNIINNQLADSVWCIKTIFTLILFSLFIFEDRFNPRKYVKKHTV